MSNREKIQRNYYSFSAPVQDFMTREHSVRQGDALLELDETVRAWMPKVRVLPSAIKMVFLSMVSNSLQFSLTNVHTVNRSPLDIFRSRNAYINWETKTFSELQECLISYFKVGPLFNNPTAKEIKQLKIALQAAEAMNVSYIRLAKRFGAPRPYIGWNTPNSAAYSIRRMLQRFVANKRPSERLVMTINQAQGTLPFDTSSRIKSLYKKVARAELRLSPLALRIYMKSEFLEEGVGTRTEKFDKAREFVAGLPWNHASKEAISQYRYLMGLLARIRKLTTTDRAPPPVMLSILG